MDGIFATARTAVVIFAATNVDDLVVVTVLFLSARVGGQPRAWQIWAGQYAGIAALVAVSVTAALGLLIVPGSWVGLLGIVPLGLGVYRLVTGVGAADDRTRAVRGVPAGLLSVTGLTIANGGDNIAVYVPVFRTIGVSATLLTLALFAGGVALWCLAGSWLGSHKKLVEIIERNGVWIVPAVYILIGVAIVINSGIIGRLL